MLLIPDSSRLINRSDLPDYNKLMEEKKTKQVYPNELTCDIVRGFESSTLSIDAPDGLYRVWMVFGYANTSYSREMPPLFDTIVSINGKPKQPVRLRVSAVIERRSYSCKAVDGKITFNFSTDKVQWNIAAIMIYSPDQEDKAAQEIAVINEEIDNLPPQLRPLWKFRERLDPETMVKLTDAEKARGYVIFQRSYLHEVFIDSKPTREEISPTPEAPNAFAALGEFEPLTFSIYALADKHIQSVTAQLPDTSLTVHYVVNRQYKEGGYNSAPTGRYRNTPAYLLPINDQGVVVCAHEPVRFWLTAQPGENVEPGIKQGQATLHFADGSTCDIPLKLQVLPFRLKKDPNITYSAYYDTPLWFFMNGNWKGHPHRNIIAQVTEDYTRAILADMRDHGMNALSAPVSWTLKDGKPVASSVQISNYMFAMYREYGLDKSSLYWRINKDGLIKAAQGTIVKQQWRSLPNDLNDP